MSFKEYNITNRSFFSIGPHLLGLIFIAVGLFTIVSPLFMPGGNSVAKALTVGSISIVFGLLVVASYSGTLFDFVTKRYKNYYSLSGFQFGKWESLPKLRLIKVFPHTFNASTTSNGVNPSATIQSTQYIVALYTDQPKPFMSFAHNDRSQALKDAQVLADHFEVVLDIQLSETNGIFSIKK